MWPQFFWPRSYLLQEQTWRHNEKAFRDRGSGFVIMKAFIDWHKKYIEWWKKKLKISNYGIVWISFIKGLIIGLLIYHFFIK